jgi:hypothetical protein
MSNNRIFWAIEGVAIAPEHSVAFSTGIVHGLQSIGITTTFNLEQVFEIGQLAIYENIENIPDVEVTMEKVLDGYPLIYHLATQGYSSGTLAGRSNQRCNVLMNIYGDTQDSASGVPQTEVMMSGMYISSVTYTFPVDGNCSEAVTLVGNDKNWRSDNFLLSSEMFDNEDSPVAVAGVQRRENVIFNSVTDGTATLLPTVIEGISASGTNDKVEDQFNAHVQTLTISVDFGREQLNELGRRSPYFRYINYPVEVTTEVEVTSSQGDQIDANELGNDGLGNNLIDETIYIILSDSTTIDLGTKNKLANVSYGGADAGGGNATSTYSFTTFNEFTVTHSGDPGA